MVTKKHLVYYNLKKHMKNTGKGKIILQWHSFVCTIALKHNNGTAITLLFDAAGATGSHDEGRPPLPLPPSPLT